MRRKRKRQGGLGLAIQHAEEGLQFFRAAIGESRQECGANAGTGEGSQQRPLKRFPVPCDADLLPRDQELAVVLVNRHPSLLQQRLDAIESVAGHEGPRHDESRVGVDLVPRQHLSIGEQSSLGLDLAGGPREKGDPPAVVVVHEVLDGSAHPHAVVHRQTRNVGDLSADAADGQLGVAANQAQKSLWTAEAGQQRRENDDAVSAFGPESSRRPRCARHTREGVR